MQTYLFLMSVHKNVKTDINIQTYTSHTFTHSYYAGHSCRPLLLFKAGLLIGL